MSAYFAIFSILSEMDFNSMGTWLNHFRWFSLILSSIEATSWKKKKGIQIVGIEKLKKFGF